MVCLDVKFFLYLCNLFLKSSNYLIMNLDELLNPSQKAAVEYNDGASVIVAGAGSGKTRVLTYKIAYLLEQGMMAYNILALTFTNKAAREMRERIMRVVGPSASRGLWMGTFHSIFSRILRAESELLGFTPQFTIYDTADSKTLIKSIIKELQLDDKTYKASAIQSRISNAKNHLIMPVAYNANSANYADDKRHNTPEFGRIYDMYCRRCREANAMDFDDLLVYTAYLFKQRPDVLQRYQERFQYILVDEYQDTNTVQHSIVMQLAALHGRVCVVGDDAQSIYSFRGAEIDNILGFQRCFANCRLFKLEQNYRSTQTIVNAANSLIAKNRNQIPKTVYSKLSVGEPIEVVSTYSDFEEGYAVAKDIQYVVKNKFAAYEDVAILYRTNAQSRVLEESLRKSGIPYKIYGGLSFYQRKEIKDVIAYLRLIINPSDEEALKRVINYPARGIGDTTQQKLLSVVHDNPRVPALEIIADPLKYGVDVKNAAAGKLQKFAELINSFLDENEQQDAYHVAERVVFGSGIMADVSADTSVENLSRKENIQEFLNAVHEFCDQKVNNGDNDIRLVNFLNEVSLITDQDTDKEEDLHAVTLMTVHAAKGLEFTNIYIVGMEENLFPSMMVESERDLEEERRLFYVAITRAKERCMITYAKSRFRNGQTQFSNPSRFLHDIDRRYLRLPNDASFGGGGIVDPYSMFDNAQCIMHNAQSFSSRQSDRGKGLFKKAEIIKTPVPKQTHKGSFKPVSSASRTPASPQNVMGFYVGECVEHSTFGQGKILEITGEGDNRKARIAFDDFGEKQLLLKYARLSKA